MDLRSAGALHIIARADYLADAENRAKIRAVLDATTEPHLEIREGDVGDLVTPGGPPIRSDVVMFVFDGWSRARVGVPAARSGGRQTSGRIALLHDRSAHRSRFARPCVPERMRCSSCRWIKEDLVARAVEDQRDAPPRLRSRCVKGKLISLVSVSGGAGVTTIGGQLCPGAWRTRWGKKVALVDLDFQSGDLAVALNVEPERSILDA